MHYIKISKDYVLLAQYTFVSFISFSLVFNTTHTCLDTSVFLLWPFETWRQTDYILKRVQDLMLIFAFAISFIYMHIVNTMHNLVSETWPLRKCILASELFFSHFSFTGAACNCSGSLLSLSWLLLFSAYFSVSHPSAQIAVMLPDPGAANWTM